MTKLMVIVFLAHLATNLYSSEHFQFFLNAQYKVIRYVDHEIKPCNSPKECLNKDIFEVLSTDNTDKQTLQDALKIAVNEKRDNIAQCTFNNQFFLILIESIENCKNSKKNRIKLTFCQDWPTWPTQET